jgi:hypothetical protein
LSLRLNVITNADDASDPPDAIAIPPQVHEPALSGKDFGFSVIEPMNSDFYRAIALYGVDSEAAREQVSSHVPADVLSNVVSQFFTAKYDAILIVIELQIVGEEPAEFVQITPVIAFEESSVECSYCLFELRLRFDAVESLRMRPANDEREQSW